ncbi:ABC transporter ATP-binding protein [Pseudaquidulcibacter saccharophilus]|uniref:ABC transporter ATP-binding protein n=1 Tax=Pseudaquidulcibacter saccharophilus TaxID=2831900 RepID=UPI001EFF543A|nr:ABC transporter ATP-binding protein [Pseudaquidulcibacter saccharophilus]
MPSQPTKQQNPLLRFWNGWLKHQTPTLILAAIMMIIVAISVNAQALMVGIVADALANLRDNPNKVIKFGVTAKQAAAIIPYAIVIVSLLRGIGWYVSNVATNVASMKATTDLQSDLFSKILTLDYSRIIKEQSGAFSARFLNDINAIREATLKVANSFVRETFTLIFTLFMMVNADWQLAIITLILLPIAYFPVSIIGKKIRKSAAVAQGQASQLSGVIEESLGGIRLVKTYSMEDIESARVTKSLLHRMQLVLKVIEQRGRLLPILEILGGIAVASVIAFATYRISTGQSTVGNLLTFIVSLINASASLRTFGDMNNQLQEGVAALNRFYEILDEKPNIKNKDNAIKIDRVVGNIKFEDVFFKVGDNEILKGISFSVKAGKKIALVGASGAGKSTIINLLPRLFDVTSGKILVDDYDIRDLDLLCLRNQIALVSQDAVLFETTIAENVCFGAGQKSEAEIIAALQDAACDFVFKLPDGINSMVAPRGSNFSGGEKQRLSIARAILRNSPILLLDEPTSALDSENEAKIAHTLDKFCENRTTLVVAHRLSTVRNADTIMVMQQGNIVESGTHNELIDKGGIYSELAKLQLN